MDNNFPQSMYFHEPYTRRIYTYTYIDIYIHCIRIYVYVHTHSNGYSNYSSGGLFIFGLILENKYFHVRKFNIIKNFITFLLYN